MKSSERRVLDSSGGLALPPGSRIGRLLGLGGKSGGRGAGSEVLPGWGLPSGERKADGDCTGRLEARGASTACNPTVTKVWQHKLEQRGELPPEDLECVSPGSPVGGGGSGDSGTKPEPAEAQRSLRELARRGGQRTGLQEV